MNGYLGIDVSKGYADFSLLSADKVLLEDVFQLDDTSQGHQSLHRCLSKWIKKYGITHLYCGLESTGGFENNWYGSLSSWKERLPMSVARLNPSGIKKNIQAGLKRNVTDSLSSQYIAEYLISHPEVVSYELQDTTYSSYRSLHKHIFLQKKQKTQLINQLKALLYTAFPEMVRFCRSSIPDWVLALLQKWPSASRIAKAKPEQLAKINHVHLKKAEDIIARAKQTVASQTKPTVEFLIKSLALQILEKEKYIDQCKALLEEHCKGPEVELLTSVVGIGNYSAAATMIEIENINRFPSPKHLVSYFGLHPVLKESGDKTGVSRMSKKGRAAMRAVLYMCAKTAAFHDQHMKKIYHRHRSRGKTDKQAIGVIMQKMLRIIWAILTKRTKYDSAVDQKNQSEKTPQLVKKSELDNKRRFQGFDQDAPVTNKQARKRRAHTESQASESRSSAGSSIHAQ